MADSAREAVAAARKLSRAVDHLRFGHPTTHVYNPLDYAWGAHQQYLQRINPSGVRVLLMGMNPGPWGMAQTGVPFGQIELVRDWLGIDQQIGHPALEHPKRPITGFACTRREVSGERLWSLFRARFGTPDCFFQEHFVANYCPLVFMEASGRNRTPDKLPAGERDALNAVCDEHLRALFRALKPEWVVGIGAYAHACLERVVGASTIQVARILHPSPASPAANRGWAATATKQLVNAGIWTSD
ncbi:MAG: single-stranded DNA-binding protein [Pirellulales bacterium]|nr:single-stranded DNA-binding protein [Pirellulales bacterium]